MYPIYCVRGKPAMRQKICYLCGLDLEKKKSRDHVPPKKFYSPEIRLRYKTKLLTLPAHQTCNRDFQKDEDYLVATLAPLVQDSYSGGSLYRHWLQTYKKGKQVPLARAVLAEFDPRPSGLVLPGNRVVKRLDG